MKTAKNILAMLFVATTLVFASCSKDEDDNKDNSPSISLDGTSWEATSNSSFTYMNNQIDVDILFSLDFTSKECEMFTDINVQFPAAPQNNRHQSSTDNFKYKFDGKTLKLIDRESNSASEVMDFNAADSTFIMYIPNVTQSGINLRDMFGSDRLIFRLIRGTLNL